MSGKRSLGSFGNGNRYLRAAARRASQNAHRGRRVRTIEPLENRYVLDSTVVLNEIMYNPAGSDESLEFIELHNQQGVDMDISGWGFDRGVSYRFPAGTTIPRFGYLVVAADPAALASAGFAGALGPYVGNLSNGGETLALVNNSDRVMDEVDYSDDQPWPLAADGSGVSLAKRTPNAGSGDVDNWSASLEIGGTPGAANFPVVDLSPQSQTLVQQNATWRYDDTGTDLGTSWSQSNFDDASWSSGEAPIVAGNIGTPPTTPPASLVAYWNFDDNVDDHSATGVNDGTIVGATYDTSVPAAIGSGKSMSFSGGASRVAIAPHASLNSSVFTLAYWIKDPGQTTGTGNSGSGNIGHNRITSRANDSFETAVSNNAAAGGNSSIKFHSNGWTETTFTTTPNQWIHMAYVANGSMLTIYANGQPVYAASRAISPIGLMNIGTRHTNTTEGFVGNVDDVAMWNIALPQASIQALATGAANPISVSLPITVGSSTATWRLSTETISGGPAGNWDPSGNPPPPAASTFTLVPTATGPLVVPSINTAANSMGVQGIVAQNNVRYYRTTFELPEFGAVSANIRMAVDNGAQVYLNGQLLATEVTFSGDPFLSPYPSITIEENGAVSVTKFDSSAASFTNWNVGTNEIILAVRNTSAESGNAGGFAFRMDVLATTVTGNTIVDLGPTTHYFRHEFDLDAAAAQVSLLELTPLADDGAVYYLNGAEVYRRNMPAGAIGYGTLASTEIGSPAAGLPVSIPSSALVAGRNVLAVEVHQASLDSDDMAMAASLRAVVVPVDPRQPSSLKFDEVASALAPFWIELTNVHSQAIDVGGYEIRSSNEMTAPYVFPSQFVQPGERIIVDAATLGFPVVDNDKLFLFRPGGNAVADAVLMRNRLQGRHPDFGDRWLTPDVPTPGAANSFALHDEIVINEIMYNPRGLLGTPDMPATYQTTSLVSFADTWKFNRSGANLGATWYQTNQPVGGDWQTGQTLIGVESSALPEPLRTTWGDYSQAVTTYYYQKEFTFAGAPAGSELVFRHVIDDGAVFYLNGVELADIGGGSTRFGMPAGAVTSGTFASTSIDNANYSGYIALNPAILNVGTNVLSVEVHQINATSSDTVFGLEMLLREELTPFIPGQPYRDNEQQWIELYNRSQTTVDLTEWEINGVDYEFPMGTTIAPGEYLVVARDVVTLAADYPSIRILGPFAGEIQRGGEKLELRDALDNPADVVEFFDSGRWHEFADGGGSSLELRDPDADNAQAQAWAASDESDQTAWQTVTYRGVATSSSVGPDGQWQEFLLGLLDAGEVLLDDIRVTQNPSSATPIQLIQNGTFQGDSIGALPAAWRLGGTHGSHGKSVVVADPTNPTNKVLRLVATSASEHMFNHIETTLKNGATIATITNGVEYEISYRVKHITGDRQVNTRLYFNRLPKTTIIDAPQLGGTPGAQNSRYETNIGPTHSGLMHSPTVPAAGQTVSVSVDAADPDGVASAVLWYSVNSGTWQSVAMQIGASGRLSGEIPGQAAGAVVQFYVESTDGLGATATFPALGRESRALYQVEDGRAQLSGATALHNFRIVMTPTDANLLHAPTNALSNDRIGATIIYDEGEVFYDAGIRLKGSERGRRQDVRISFNVEFQPDQLFRGVHDNVAVDRSGAGDQFSQKEIIVEHIVTRAGDIPHEYSDLIRAITPRTTHTGTAMLMMARYGDVFLDSQFENGGDGTLFEYELIYYPAGTTDGNPESPKLPYPNADGVVGVSITNLGDDKERYRWPFLIKNNRDADDYSRLIDMAKTFALSGASYSNQINSVIDVDQWLRAFAVGILTGIGDSYFTGAQHNLEVYVRPEDDRVLLFPHDMDFSFSAGATSSLTPNGDLNKMLSIPGNGHHYYGHVQDIVTTTFNATYMTPWINHYDALLPSESFTSFISYISSRASSALSQINAAIPPVSFAITTNGGADHTVNAPTVTLQGTGWVNVRNIRLDGDDTNLPVTWVNNNTWQLTLPIDFGPNPIALEAFDFQGNQIATDSITVTSTISVRPLQDFLRVSELMYHPADETAEELAAGFNDADEFEFIEFQNTSTTETLDLSGVRLIAGVQFDFATASVATLAPGERLLLVKNEAAFAFRYGAGLNVAGSYGGQLDNAGETLTIVDGNNAIIQSFTYDDNGPDWHPTTDGDGYSLVIVDVLGETSQWSVGSAWRPSGQIGGSPGTEDQTGVEGDVDGDGRVDLVDLGILQRSLGTASGATPEMGDLNGDGAVNGADAAILARNFGRGSAPPSPPAAASVVITGTTRRASGPASLGKETLQATARRRVAASARLRLDTAHVDRALGELTGDSSSTTDTPLRAQRRIARR
ncbi:MAG: hypothetical protein DCC68_07760 [Planctomycetota bacterium]|nr:MAG: hypothetical protein DCC68_07760 [Planctomycetota bacterium]